MTNPDKWVIVKIEMPTYTIYKVLASWSGGYLSGDEWRLSSGIVKIEDNGDDYVIHNHSGSQYQCNKEMYGLHGLSAGVLDNLTQSAKENNGTVELLDDSVDIMTIDFTANSPD